MAAVGERYGALRAVTLRALLLLALLLTGIWRAAALALDGLMAGLGQELGGGPTAAYAGMGAIFGFGLRAAAGLGSAGGTMAAKVGSSITGPHARLAGRVDALLLGWLGGLRERYSGQHSHDKL